MGTPREDFGITEEEMRVLHDIDMKVYGRKIWPFYRGGYVFTVLSEDDVRFGARLRWLTTIVALTGKKKFSGRLVPIWVKEYVY